jgi:hypothetical protein
MCLEGHDYYGTTVHLLRPLGPAYCGEVCFGVGARSTADPYKANCCACKNIQDLEESIEHLEMLRSPLDQIVREIEK